MGNDDDDHSDSPDVEKLNIHLSFALVVVSSVASLIMIISYFCQTSRAPRLLLWLFLSNYFWFFTLSLLYAIHVLDKSVLQQEASCTSIATGYFFFLTFSMLWPSVICFDLLQSTREPRWRWDSPAKIERVYLVIVALIAAAATSFIVVTPDLSYCDVTRFEAPGSKASGLAVEFILPVVAFLFNAAVMIFVRRSLTRELPFSVRTRRRRQLHNYVLVWAVCWGPYLVNAIWAYTHPGHAGPTAQVMFLVRNACLYSAGYFDLIVYGLQNAWLKRSLRMACDRCLLTSFVCFLDDVQPSYLKTTKEKVVMFDPSVPDSTPTFTSKDYVLRKRLTKEEKYHLYKVRPDLDFSRPSVDPEDYDEPDHTLLAYDDKSLSGYQEQLRQEMEAQEFGVSRSIHMERGGDGRQRFGTWSGAGSGSMTEPRFERRSRSSTENEATLLSPLLDSITSHFTQGCQENGTGTGAPATEDGGVDEEKGELLVPEDYRELLPTSIGGSAIGTDHRERQQRDSSETETGSSF
uniref:Uncharacterized protein n=1 Tax=Rhizochromulina marina TaxID=1034831 RepID=A0A7S2WVV0_9STRA|mmetsp:Transcript_9041/g.25840  ORF Transcript_9041/g.25840 Transcript_9041/m.25840 type:complete len:519 (+) Transcript_9041:250-1806(+)|eukprot:CAMPEP_0118976616 /NCGR_PEP_ID=MMETSP1173-20130426/19301_1 /TAXON_ID=1034831 /ORGANISM="Rhizochromulina marina cf, Strain CCMP1243" /LENGTH=518 /DNA_ID=CAMNT_0006926665 /DNA_START=200 /DNA_END=1756 /DNA_ORIENTATION=-